MDLFRIITLLAFLAYAAAETSTVQVSRQRLLPTRTPCIATQTFLDELRKMLLESERKESLVSKSYTTVYTRWGRKECPPSNHLVYKGSAAGTHYSYKAGPADILCLPDEPEYGNYTTSLHDRGSIYGTEYKTQNQLSGLDHLHDQDVPCAVCETDRMKTIMIPAKKSCPRGWHVEYTGYLMSGHYNHAASEYVCVDRKAQSLNCGHESKNGHLLYLVEGVCGALPCPPYIQYAELTCVVCSK